MEKVHLKILLEENICITESPHAILIKAQNIISPTNSNLIDSHNSVLINRPFNITNSQIQEVSPMLHKCSYMVLNKP